MVQEERSARRRVVALLAGWGLVGAQSQPYNERYGIGKVRNVDYEFLVLEYEGEEVF
jgi:hypothetical protein